MCNFPKPMSAAEHTEHFQGHWSHEPSLLPLWAYLRLPQPHVAHTRTGRQREEQEYWSRSSGKRLAGLRDPHLPPYRKK